MLTRSRCLSKTGFFGLSLIFMIGATTVESRAQETPSSSTATTKFSSGLEDFFAKLGKNKITQRLNEHGLYLNSSYLGEFAANPHGGQRPHHHTYSDQSEWGLTADMNKLSGWKGGWMQAIFTYRHGHSLANRYLNHSISVQQIYGDGQTFRLTTLSVMQSFNNNKFNILLGRLPAKGSYFTSDLYCDFQSNAICGDPASITSNTNPTSFPMPSWGVRFRYYITPHLAATTGAYEALEANYVKHSKHGFYWGTKHDTGVWIPFELRYKTTSKDTAYPSQFSIGGAFDTGNGFDAKGRKYHQRVMVWGQAEKMFWKPDPTGTRGITAFSALSLGTSKRQTYQYQMLGGVVYQGPFATRTDDKAAFFATALRSTKGNRVGPTKRHPTYFTLEANYSYQMLRGVVVMPNFQYVVHPDGNGGKIAAPSNGRIKNAIVVGTQISVDTSKLMKMAKSGMPD